MRILRGQACMHALNGRTNEQMNELTRFNQSNLTLLPHPQHILSPIKPRLLKPLWIITRTSIIINHISTFIPNHTRLIPHQPPKRINVRYRPIVELFVGIRFGVERIVLGVDDACEAVCSRGAQLFLRGCEERVCGCICGRCGRCGGITRVGDGGDIGRCAKGRWKLGFQSVATVHLSLRLVLAMCGGVLLSGRLCPDSEAEKD